MVRAFSSASRQIVNDDWNTIEKLPTDAGRLAARTEDLLVLMTLFDPATRALTPLWTDSLT